jgi:UDP-glucose 4-epimerase
VPVVATPQPSEDAPAGSRVLVTGGAGFIGSHVVDALLAAGHRPRILDLRRSEHHLPGSVEEVRSDLGNFKALQRAMSGCHAVIHLAAAADVGEVAKDPVESERRNARCTLHVLEAARRANVKRVVYASTIWVYSDVLLDHVDEETPLLPPAHLYTATKLAGELYCRAYQELYGLEYTVLRFGIPYGPRARPAAVIPQFVQKALDGTPLTIAGDGSQSRAFVYVEDLADGVVRALAPVAANRVYNLAADQEVTIAEIADAVCEQVKPVPIERVPARGGDFAGAAVSNERAKAELGWSAATSFSEGLGRYVAWHTTREAAPVSTRAWLPAMVAGMSRVLLGLWVLVSLVALAALDPLADAVGRETMIVLGALLLVPLATAVLWPQIGRPACWGLASAELAVALLPWPGALGRVGHEHQISLLIVALVAVAAADVAGRGRVLRPHEQRT